MAENVLSIVLARPGRARADEREATRQDPRLGPTVYTRSADALGVASIAVDPVLADDPAGRWADVYLAQGTQPAAPAALEVPETLFGSNLIAWYAGSYDSGTGVWTDRGTGANNGQGISGAYPSTSTTPGGAQSLVFNGTTNGVDLGDVTYLDGLSSFTIWCSFKGGAQSAYAALLSKAYSAATLYLGGDGSGVSLQAEAGTFAVDPAISAASPFDSSWHRAVWVVNAGVGTIYIDGSAQADTQASGGTVSNISEHLVVGAGGDGASWAFFFSGEIRQVGIGLTALNSTDVATLDTYLSGDIGGGLSNISGSTSFAFSPSGSAKGTASATLSSSFAFTPTGTASGSTSLAASTSFAFTPSGSANGSTALAGSSSFAFTPAGSASGGGSISGSSSFAFTPSGSAAGLAAIAGSTSFAFTPSGSASGVTALAGSSAFAFTPSGQLEGLADITGATTVTFATSGTLLGRADMTGTATLTFTPAGTLTAFVATPTILIEDSTEVFVCPADAGEVYLPGPDATEAFVCPADAAEAYLPAADASEVMPLVVDESEVAA